MRFWPKKKWKKMILSAFLIILAALVIVVGYLEYSVYREVSSPLEVLNSNGAKTALVIYHPGLSPFAHDIAYAFANGLASSGWRVEIATASPQAPTNLSNVSLLVLCWPIYDLNPGPTITSQIQRIGNLQGIHTVIVAVGGGINPLDAPGAMNRIVQNANGTIIQSLTAFRSQHNQQALQEEASKITP